MKIDKPRISIIVPIYNTEKYLHRCLDSILAQTFVDFELLLINDGSIDNSGKICDEYARKDSRVLVFHKENGGVSSARNAGLDNAHGKWIAFIDSDDWIDSTYLEHLLEGDENVELRYSDCYASRKMFDGNRNSTNEMILFENIAAFYDRYFNMLTSSWGKLFLKEIINKYNIVFDEDLSYGEDTVFSIRYLVHVKSILAKKHAEYHYSNTDNSLSKHLSSEKVERFVIRLEEELSPMLKNNKLSFSMRKFLANRYLIFTGVRIRELYFTRKLHAKWRRRCLSRIYKEFDRLNIGWRITGSMNLSGMAIALRPLPVFVSDVIFVFLFFLWRINKK